jgi:hypothetical protein
VLLTSSRPYDLIHSYYLDRLNVTVVNGSCVARSDTELLRCPLDSAFNFVVLGKDFWLKDGDGNRISREEQLPTFTVAPLLISTCLRLDNSWLYPIPSLPFPSYDIVLCTMQPTPDAPLNVPIPLLLKQTGGQSNLVFNSTTLSPATIALKGCPAGQQEHRVPDADTRCQPCPAGSSTDNEEG